MRNETEIEVEVIAPQSEAAEKELKMRAAAVHADFVLNFLGQREDSEEEKKRLLDGILAQAERGRFEKSVP